MIALRPYQEQGVAEIRSAFAAGRRRVLFVLPTGGFKGIVFCFVVVTTGRDPWAPASPRRTPS